MPKVDIDYSNTIIYKIACRNPDITDIYVGHTTNFVQRKHSHKGVCNNINSPYYNLKLYKTIREHGNWENWEMSILNFYNCKDHFEARQKEQEYFISLGATLNSVEPMISKKIINNIKVQSSIAEPNINLKNNFVCKCCDYKTTNKKDFNKHLSTDKHNKRDKSTKFNETPPNPKLFDCKCGKAYKERSGLWRHKQKCNNLECPQLNANLVIELLKQNQELQKSLIELSKEKTVTNNSITNSNNKTFNIQVYLNEDCKDALNISEFVSSIQLQLHDLEETGRLGYVDGVSQIITTKLNDLDATKRPIQCSDVKRETLYIKDENKWIKEDDKKEKIKTAIKQITRKNIQQIPVWIKANPGCLDPDSKDNDTYLQIVSNAMSGSTTEEQSSNLNKIVTKISKEAVINK
jgi:hypothetical protein